MADITNPRLLYAKGGLFVLLGILSAGLLVAERPTLTTCLLLAIAIWSFSRAYYFCFYVIEHYIDPGYRFAGLTSFVRYLLASRRSNRGEAGPGETDRASRTD